MSKFGNGEQLQLDGMERYGVPDGWTPTVTTEISDQPRFRTYRVSEVGQLTLPASARERWGLKNGGSVNVFEVDGAIFVFPEQIHTDTARELIHQAMSPISEDFPQAETRPLSMRGIVRNIIGEYE